MIDSFLSFLSKQDCCTYIKPAAVVWEPNTCKITPARNLAAQMLNRMISTFLKRLFIRKAFLLSLTQACCTTRYVCEGFYYRNHQPKPYPTWHIQTTVWYANAMTFFNMQFFRVSGNQARHESVYLKYCINRSYL